MSEPEKRIGRQSAENTIKTRKDILDAATALFCQQGYANVSLRAISERAGVSHSLIRHHFGTKLDVWQRVCDRIQDYFHSFVSSLTQAFSPELGSNQRLFYVLINLQAVLMLDPRPIQLMADSMGQGQALHDYIFDDEDDIAILIGGMLNLCHQEGNATHLSKGELEWLMCSFAHSYASLAPLAKNTYPASTPQQGQVQHWRLFAHVLATQLGLTATAIPAVEDLASFVAQSQFKLDIYGDFDYDQSRHK